MSWKGLAGGWFHKGERNGHRNRSELSTEIHVNKQGVPWMISVYDQVVLKWGGWSKVLIVQKLRTKNKNKKIRTKTTAQKGSQFTGLGGVTVGVSVRSLGGCWFEPQPRHTKTSKMECAASLLDTRHLKQGIEHRHTTIVQAWGAHWLLPVFKFLIRELVSGTDRRYRVSGTDLGFP